MLTIAMLVILALSVYVLVLSRKLSNARDIIASDESLFDQWQAYADSKELELITLQDALYAMQAQYSNGNKGELPLIVAKAKMPITDRYINRAGKLIAESKPEAPKTESKSDKNQTKKTDNGRVKTESAKTGGIVEQTESILGCTTNDVEKSLISKWESGKGKADCAEYAKRLQGIRKNSK